jgi:two-component sensor histidine kinase
MPSELDVIRQQQAAFARFTTRALSETNLDALLLDACIRARAGLHASHAKLLEYLPAEDKLLLRSGVGWKPGYVGVYRAPADVDSAIGCAFNLAEPVPVHDYEDHKRLRWPDILREHGCVSSLNVPVRGESGIFGVLEVDHQEVRQYSSDDINFLMALGNTVARAVELHRVQQAKDRALADKDLLMREMNHRIKNNLSLVAAMLSLQSKRFAHSEMRREFEDAISRVSTLAHVHDRIQKHMIGDSDAASYFADLCGMLRSLTPKNVQLTCTANGTLPSDNVETLALLVNELVTNACKYAFPGGRAGKVDVSFSGSGEDWRLVVRDDGVGLPANFDAHGSGSFGMTLIRTLANQLNASVDYASEAGTMAEVVSAFHTDDLASDD